MTESTIGWFVVRKKYYSLTGKSTARKLSEQGDHRQGTEPVTEERATIPASVNVRYVSLLVQVHTIRSFVKVIGVEQKVIITAAP